MSGLINKLKEINFKEALKLIEKWVFVLPLLTAFSYIVAYLFEVGFLATYGIPYQFAEIKTTSFVLVFLLFTMFIFMVSTVYDEFKDKKTDSTKLHSNRTIIIFALFVVLLVWISFGPIVTTIITLLALFFYIAHLFPTKFKWALKEPSNRQYSVFFIGFVAILFVTIPSNRGWCSARWR